MTTDVTFDAERPVDDRYSPPAYGELDEIDKVFADGRLSGGAPVLAIYEQALAEWFGTKRAIAVNSGTSALHATLVALDVGPSDEVLVPATAPLPTAMPILTCGATPVIVDTAPGSLALDHADVCAKLTVKTKAAITLPLWGYPADDHQIHVLLAGAAIPVVEDACQSHGTKIGRRYAGTHGRAGCFSTHDRKPLSTGEGGFVLTADEELAERIDFYSRLGHLRGDIHGVNYKLAGPLAAIGLRRLSVLENQLQKRRVNAALLLVGLPQDAPLAELAYEETDSPNYYNLVLVTSDHLEPIAAELAAAGLPPDSIRYGYRPLYHQPLFARYRTRCPNAEALIASTLQFPVHPGLSEPALEWLADRIYTIATRHAERQPS